MICPAKVTLKIISGVQKTQPRPDRQHKVRILKDQIGRAVSYDIRSSVVIRMILLYEIHSVPGGKYRCLKNIDQLPCVGYRMGKTHSVAQNDGRSFCFIELFYYQIGKFFK